MRKQVILVCVLLLATIVEGCYYDSILDEQTNLPTNVSFGNDVLPILVTNCTLSGCHDATPAHDPSMVAEQAYDAIIEGHYVNSIAPTQSVLYSEVASGNMPPTGPLSQKDVKIILAWITEGAKNN